MLTQGEFHDLTILYHYHESCSRHQAFLQFLKNSPHLLVYFYHPLLKNFSHPSELSYSFNFSRKPPLVLVTK